MLSSGLLWAALVGAALATSPAPTSAVVSVAEGPPFVLMRGTKVASAARGAYLSRGDLIETGSDTLLILEFTSAGGTGALVAIGPSTRAYWMEHEDIATLAVRRGWVKVDTLSSAKGMEFRVEGARLGAASDAGTYVVHVGEEADEVFHESGSMTLRVQTPDGGGAGVFSKPNEFSSRGDAGEVQTRPGPAAAFVAALPLAFRDPLPPGMAAKLHGKADPQVIRDVAYEDLADWLAAPRDWRRGFIERFRPRLTDPAFLRALDAHMSAHPEWKRVVHPSPAAAPRPERPAE